MASITKIDSFKDIKTYANSFMDAICREFLAFALTVYRLIGIIEQSNSGIIVNDNFLLK